MGPAKIKRRKPDSRILKNCYNGSPVVYTVSNDGLFSFHQAVHLPYPVYGTGFPPCYKPPFGDQFLPYNQGFAHSGNYVENTRDLFAIY